MAKKRLNNNDLNTGSKIVARLNKLHKTIILKKDDRNIMSTDNFINNKTSVLIKTSDSISPIRDDETWYNSHDF